MISPQFSPTRRQLETLYQGLLAAYGPQAWWPADSAFEVMVGAVLTQNTAWTNVERAVNNLKAADALSVDVIEAMPAEDLARLIRPSGYYNIKAGRLQNLCRFLHRHGGEAGLSAMDTQALRSALLRVKGVGHETADDILLYAFERPVFVIDAYTRRLLRRHRLARGDESYDTLRLGFEGVLPTDVAMFKQYHALIVQHAKVACASRPRCGGCCLERGCAKDDA